MPALHPDDAPPATSLTADAAETPGGFPATDPPAAPLVRRFGDVLHACRRHWRYAALFSALLNLLFLAPMLYMIQVYDRVVPTRGTLTLLLLTLALVGALGVLAMLDLVRTRLLVRASAAFDEALAGPILRAALDPRAGPAMLRARTLRECEALRGLLGGPAMIALFDAPWSAIYILVCFAIHPAAGILALVGAVALAILARLHERRQRAPLADAHAATAQCQARQDHSIQLASLLRALGMGGALARRHRDERVQATETQLAASLAGGQVSALSKFLRLLLQSIGLGLGAHLAIGGAISPGAIFATSFLIGRALAPIDQLIAQWRGLQRARETIGLVDTLLAGTSDEAGRTILPAPEGRLEACDLRLAGQGGARDRLDGVGLRLQPGEVLAVVGASGAGKSTLLSALAGALDCDSGEVRVDGASVSDWPTAELARHIGYLPAQPALLAGTIKDNIARFARPDATRSQAEIDALAIDAARQAAIHDTILGFEAGYDHRLAPGGGGLSLGQAQRIALARALFDNPRYLILDEPNAHLDGESDRALAQVLAARKAAGTTMVIAAHRLTFLSLVDRLMLLDQGRVVEDGPCDTVLRRLAPPPVERRAQVVRTPRPAPGPRGTSPAPDTPNPEAALGELS